jgi:hypothetical protein
MRRPVRRDWFVLGGIVLLVNLPWYIAATVREPNFLRYFLWQHNVVRFVEPFDHQRGVWFYVPIVLLGLMPATLLLLPFLRFLLSGKEENAERRSPELGFLLLTGGWCLLFFTVSGCKLPTYILPAFPPLALAFGHFLAHGRWSVSRWPIASATSMFLFLLLFHHVALPWYAEHRSPIRQAQILRHHCGDPSASVVCYPRPCNVVSFYLGRDDLRNYRSKEIEDLRTLVRSQPRTIILCTHRSSLQGLRELLPPEVSIVETHHFGLPDIPFVPTDLTPRLNDLLGRTALGLSDLAVIEMNHGKNP